MLLQNSLAVHPVEIWREKYESKWESSANFGVKMKKIKPPPEDTHRETNSSHLKIGHPKRKRLYSGYPFACAKICLFQGGYILQSKRLFLFQIPLPSSQSMLKVHCRCTPSWKGKMSFIGKFHYPSVFQKNIKGTISIRWLSPFLNIWSIYALFFLEKNWQNIGLFHLIIWDYWTVSTVGAVDVSVSYQPS